MLSSEEASRTAPLKSPSSSLAETRAARVSRGSRSGLLFLLSGTGCSWSGVGSDSSPISRLMRDARILRCPPLSGTRRQRGAKQNRRFQAASEPPEVTWSRILANFLADRSREARGILFTVFTESLGRLRARAVSGVEVEKGGFRDPGQRLATGPCTRTRPHLVIGMDQRQTAHSARERWEASGIGLSINTTALSSPSDMFTHFCLLLTLAITANYWQSMEEDRTRDHFAAIHPPNFLNILYV